MIPDGNTTKLIIHQILNEGLECHHISIDPTVRNNYYRLSFSSFNCFEELFGTLISPLEIVSESPEIPVSIFLDFEQIAPHISEHSLRSHIERFLIQKGLKTEIVPKTNIIKIILADISILFAMLFELIQNLEIS